MNKASFHILRVGMAVTFLWIGVLILKNPVAWSGYIEGWVLDLLPTTPEKVMIAIAIQDIAIGAFLLIDMFTWVAAAAAVFHLATVLIVSGINDVTIRDIGLLAGSLALFVQTIPQNIIFKFLKKS